MRIGVMLRHYDQHGGGVRVYTRKLLKALLDLRTPHEFVLLYRNPSSLGAHAGEAQVEEVALAAPSVLLWDQVAVPLAVRRYGVDLLFNPKYSIALAVTCPTVWVCHGLDWYVMPWASRFLDRLSHRYLVPRYAAKADAIVAVSEVTRQHVMQYLHVEPERVVTVYSGMGDAYRAPKNPERLRAVREKYRLPERFFLYAGAIYPPKNFTRLVRAFAKVGPDRGIHLVVAGGENRFLSDQEIREPEALGIAEWVRWPGWIDGEEDLAALYSMAEALLLPSLFEACPLPLLEAMAAGCPVITADRYGTKELADGAGVLVDPESVDSIASGMVRVLEDPALRAGLVQAGLERAESFSWPRCARETMGVLERAARNQRAAAAKAS
ncbi:MAG TPA: glycosyltransferase family 1 protein [Gemmatimonadales bacterium]|nr:glycosyltransferase family 1 protein [Gemmatimonadales bacterium]